ncbi:hypothetical protein ACHWQZ_G016787 [Mnemiopsis leidyi]
MAIDLVLPATDRTMNVMKPGAQQLMLHAVSPGKESTDRSADVRFSISFRRHSPVDPKNQGPDELSSSDAQGQSSGSNKFADVVLIAGDSFAARLDQKLLGKGKKNVRNISKGGRKIEAVEKDIEDFVTSNPQVGISKLFVSVGTNDIRNCQTGVKHLKKALSDLMHKIKLILPNTKIWFQSIPPINPNGSKFIARHVLLMNNLIFDMCSKFRLYYLDIFPVFLNWNGSINSRLFPPYDNVRKCFDIHPNKKGTLGINNFDEFCTHFTSLATSRKISKHILVGDFNFPEVSWPNANTPYHRAISFDIEIEVKYKSCPKRKVFNYDKGDYRGLNEDLYRINWDRVFMSNDPCLAWDIFKKTLGELCDHRIPKKTMRSQFQPPWYDSECDRIRRKKEKWRIKAKESTNESDRLTYTEKFRSMRKLFKKTMNDKMKSNFVDDSDPALISKRFWTHVKSKSKSTRIPETVQYRNRFRYEAKDQASLFNEYFYNQFSEASDYNIDIDFANNDFLDLKFYSEDILLILRSLNPSKAAGPDGIHGKVLKYCASSLAYPLRRTKSLMSLHLGPVIEIVNRKTNVSFDVDPAETNEAKKLKLDMQRSIQPTQVVHVRNAPEDITALDLCILAMKFGTVINTLIMRQKGQAFIEFAEESQAIAFVNYHNYVPAIVRSKHVFIQLSTHSHLKTNAESQSATQAALNALASYPGAQTPSAMPPAIPQIVSSSALSTAQMLPLQEGCILHLIIERAIYSVTLDTLYQIFSRFGPVAKIVTFNKNSEFQGFVQYVDQLSAMAALNSLNNQNVYSGCCTLRLSDTKMKDLDVKSNSDKARDYTKEPPQYMRSAPRLDNFPIFSPIQNPGAIQGLQYTPMIQPQLTAYPSLAPSNPVQTIATTPSTITTPTLSPLSYDKMLLPNNFKFITATTLPPHPQLGYTISSVLLVSNLAECIASPDALFILFGVYGDVRRVKILYKKPDTALVQMQDPISAQQALLSLNGVVCGDKKIYVSYSIYMEVQMPKPTDEAQDLTKDFSDSPLHRFRKPNQKVRENVYGPSPCLHLSNIPAEVTEEELKKMFESCGTIVNFRFLTSERPDKQMALLEFTNTSSAIGGLVQFHNKEFVTEAGRQYLRISFSKAGCIQK